MSVGETPNLPSARLVSVYNALSRNARTGLLVHAALGATIEDRGDHLIVRSPQNPLFHWGNFVQMTAGYPSDAPHWTTAFAEAFPEASYCAVALTGEPDPAPWASAGVTIEAETSLIAHSPLRVSTPPDGYVVRPLSGANDWDATVKLALADAPDAGAAHAQLCRDMAVVRERLTLSGEASWFGCFAGDGALAASLGIVLLEDGIARYQAVLTDARHRHRGLATHLLGVASAWARDQGARQLVIVADTGSDAARLYQTAGFTPVEQGFSAYAEIFGATDAASLHG